MWPVPASTRRKTATSGILVGLLLAALDGTVVATAMPRILDDLRGLHLYFFPVAIFMLFQTVAMPIWGRLSDLYGRRYLHLAAVVVLVLGSILCGSARTMETFVAFRSIQGVGAGGVMALSFTMVGDLFELDERAKMQGAISSVWGLAALVGPQLGGWIADHWSWRGIFYLNIPVGLAAAVLVQSAWREGTREGKGRLDWPGALLLALASGSILAAFGLAGRKGIGAAATLQTLGAAAFFAVLLVLVERRTANPFIAYDLYRNRLFSTGAATGVCAMVCLFGAVMHVPLFVAGVLGRALKTGGMMLTVMMLPWMVCSALTKPLLRRFSYRTLSIAGMLLSAAAYVLLSRLPGDATLGPVAAAMLVLGAGLGLTVAPLLIAAQNSVTKDRLGAATSLTQFTRSMGGAMGLAVMGSLLSAAVGSHDPEGLVKAREVMSPERLQATVEAFLRGLHQVFAAGAGVAALGVILALGIPAGKAHELKTSPEESNVGSRT